MQFCKWSFLPDNWKAYMIKTLDFFKSHNRVKKNCFLGRANCRVNWYAKVFGGVLVA
jgi:hypothetical protein